MLEPAFQKLYSALLALSRFQKENDFFQNISALDCFLSEYRNVTFVIQKEFAHTDKFTLYENLRETYLSDENSKWLVKKRNETQKERPFPLEKIVELCVYSRGGSYIQEKKFVTTNDEPYESVVDSARSFLLSFRELEVHFSVRYIFREIGAQNNVLDNISSGIHNMWAFLRELYKNMPEQSSLVHSLMEKIEKSPYILTSADIFMVDDYVFNSRNMTFERGKNMIGILAEWKPVPIAPFMKSINFPNVEINCCVEQDIANQFYFFVLSHVIALEKQGSIAATFWTIDKDNNMDFIMFDSSIRTTAYRITHEISDRIINVHNIKSVFYACEIYMYDKKDAKRLLTTNYSERPEKFAAKEGLAVYMFNENGTKFVLTFQKEELSMPCRIKAQVMAMQPFDGITTLDPIQTAFKTRRENTRGQR